MEDSNLPVENNSSNLNPFGWQNFKYKMKDFRLYRSYLGEKIVILNHTNIAFIKNLNGTIDYTKQINFDDLKLDLKDHGFKITEREFDSIMNSDEIEKIDSLKIFFNQLENNSWGWNR